MLGQDHLAGAAGGAVVTSMVGDDCAVMMTAMVATGDGGCGVMVTPVVMMSRRWIGGRRGDVVMAVVHPGLGRRRGQGHARQGERSGQ